MSEPMGFEEALLRWLIRSGRAGDLNERMVAWHKAIVVKDLEWQEGCNYSTFTQEDPSINLNILYFRHLADEASTLNLRDDELDGINFGTLVREVAELAKDNA